MAVPRHCIAAISCALLFSMPATYAAIATYTDKATFIADNSAASATGPLPVIAAVAGSQQVGIVTITTTNWAADPASTLLGGNVIVVSEGFGTNAPLAEGIRLEFAEPVTAAGFDFHEPSLTGEYIDSCNVVTCTDSTFSVTLFMGETQVDSFGFNAPDDAAAFVGVATTTAFDRMEIFEVVGDDDNEFYGQVYLGAATLPNSLNVALPIENPSPNIGDEFGNSVSVSGDLVLVGARADDSTGGSSGRAYLFDAVTGSLVHTLENPAPGTGDQFGDSVSLSGDRALVGAFDDNTTGSGSGRAYLFDAVSGSLVHTFDNPSPANGAHFGNAVSVSGDRILVGAFDANITGSGSGRAYLFDAVSGSLVHTFDNPSPADGDHFGNSVSVSGDRVLVGAHKDDTTNNNSGRAYLFDAVTGANISPCVPPAVAPDCGFENPSPAIGDLFGNSVSVAGDLVLVGAYLDNTTALNAGRAYLFDAISGSLVHTFDNPSPAAAGDRFGSSVSAASDDRIIVGADHDSTTGSESGRAHVFDAVTGSLIQTFENPGSLPADAGNFGTSVSASGDRVLVGALGDDTTGIDSGRAYVFFDGIQATIDILPGIFGNIVHPHHQGGPSATLNDNIPVAVLGDGNLDTSLIDSATVAFGPARGNIDPASVPIYFADYDGDLQNDDARFDFLTGDTGIGCTQLEASITGETTEGDRFAGTDYINPDCNAGCH